MTRQEKIKLLQDIANGSKTIEDAWIWPNDWCKWMQDNNDPDLFQCTNENLTWRRNEPLPDKNIDCGNVFIYCTGPSIGKNDLNTITFK